MKNKQVLGWLLGLAAGVIAILPFLPTPSTSTSDWTYFIGRFHILLLHFPIGLILLLVGIEFWNFYQQYLQTSSLLSILWITAIISCFCTIGAGFLLYQTGDYQGSLVRQHLWGGVGLGLLMIASYAWRSALVQGQSKRNSAPQKSNWKKRIYPVSLLGMLGLVIYTSHLGGALTHGPNFLTEYAPTLTTSPALQKPTEELLVFEDILLPIFEARCQSCHNQHKTKGDFLMTSYSSIQVGGKSGKAMLVSGEAAQSELYHRITLPLRDDERMPPKQKKGLSEDEVALLKWWIEEGAKEDMQWGAGPVGPEGQALADRFLRQFNEQQKKWAKDEQELAILTQKLDYLGSKLGLVIAPDPNYKGLFSVAQHIPPATITDETLHSLRSHYHLFSKVSLPGSEITDDGLFNISQMTALQELYLPKTCLKGNGLAYLSDLPQLKTINLSYSLISDAGALQLLDLPQVEKVYLYGTHVSPSVWEAIENFRPAPTILAEEGPYF
ncbi:MAG: hypothetical protein HRU41_09790 [Saprospiraceae bacterium]|nr:hypothetical protein [Saprospiraceae bacterium]